MKGIKWIFYSGVTLHLLASLILVILTRDFNLRSAPLPIKYAIILALVLELFYFVLLLGASIKKKLKKETAGKSEIGRFE
ncbi:MAG: hypothetical protein Q4G11_05640 [Gallicola sp.]|nr:hypothetical protein [Gallicola sp.]